MNQENIQYRKSFRHQPVQFLIIDVGYPMTPVVTRELVSAVENVLAIGASIRGKIRIPAFGAGIIGSNYQSVCQFDYLRGNFSRILKTLEEVFLLSSQAVKMTTDDYRDVLNYAIKKVLDEFMTRSQNEAGSLEWNQNWPTQVQITLITMKNGCGIQEMLVEIMRHQSTLKLKRIDVVQMLPREGDATIAKQKTLGYITWITCPCEAESLDVFFKGWLLESDTEAEHLRIFLSRNPQVMIRCDMDECVLDAAHLPFGHRYTLHNDVPNLLSAVPPAKLSGSDVAVYELEALNTVDSAGICPSLVFGSPRRLEPTQCWSLDWSESSLNCQLFTALCRSLVAAEQALLTCLRSQSKLDTMSVYFVLVSDGETLLVHSVAPRELTLPRRSSMRQPCSSDTEHQAATEVEHALALLAPLHEFTPHSFASGLYDSLRGNLRTTGKQSVKKPKTQTRSKTRTKAKSQLPGLYTPEFAEQDSPGVNFTSNQETPPRHPALCSPSTKAKYKHNSADIPEETEDPPSPEIFQLT